MVSLMALSLVEWSVEHLGVGMDLKLVAYWVDYWDDGSVE
jgi:hypothetical protein